MAGVWGQAAIEPINAHGLPVGYLRLLLHTNALHPPPFPSGGGAAAGERGAGLGMSACVATNVKLPRTSRGHPLPQTATDSRKLFLERC